MADIRDPRLLYAKGLLLLCAGIFAGALLLAENATWRSTLLLTITIWAFCRAYYFAFYVIEHYIDRNFRYSGLFAFLIYLLKKPASTEKPDSGPAE
jgi:hypothetical protein